MAKFFIILALSGLATVVVSGSGDKKGAALKINSAAAYCEPKVSLSVSKSESDCSDKCKKDSNCRFAVYQGKDNKCGPVPASSECTFGGAEFENVLLGFSYKKLTKKDDWHPIYKAGKDTALLTKSGKRVLDGAFGISTDACRDFCDIHPKCQMAFYEAGMGMQGCSLKGKSGVEKVKAGPGYHGTSTVYTAA